MAAEEMGYCVKVTNAFKSYGKNNVFKGLNMNVTSGCIYGLLGPSGCGKSTLLQCILGTDSLDSGRIDMAAENVKDIGYMPQDLCLDDSLTIKESFEYYGQIYNMCKENIENRIKELERFLELPSLNCYIKNLSGGQCRRVSLGISLLHDPKVIILDEPTVGIDPLLRQKIWDELTKMVEQQQKTIIITTHYIEEANQVNCIGLMRNGVLVKEGSPQFILSEYNTESLESAFLTLCSNQDTNENCHKETQETDLYQFQNVIKKNKQINIRRIKTLIKKNYRIFSRDYWLLFSVIILPMLQSLNLLMGVGGDFKGLEIAIQNEEINFFDCQFFNASGCIFDENNDQTQSCTVMNYLKMLGYKLIEVEGQQSEEIFMSNITTFVAFIYFPKNYTKNLMKFFDVTNNYDLQSEAYVHYRGDNILFKNKIEMDVTNAMNHLIEKTLKSCLNNPKAFGLPMEFNNIVGKAVKLYVHSINAVFLGMGSFYFISIYSVTTMISEKFDGLFSRSMIAGVTVTELFISLFCVSNVLIVVHLIFPIVNTYVFFSSPIELTNGLIMYAILLILLGWLGFLFGLLIAVISPTKSSGTHVMNGWAMTQFLLSGGIWPIESQPLILKKISELLPMTIACKTLNDISLKGWTWNNPSVIMGTAVTFLETIFMLLVLIALMKFKKNMWVIVK